MQTKKKSDSKKTDIYITGKPTKCVWQLTKHCPLYNLQSHRGSGSSFPQWFFASHITLDRTLKNCVTFRSFLNFVSCVYFKFYEPSSFLSYRMLQFKGNLCSSYHKGKLNTLFISEYMFSIYILTHRCFSKNIVTLVITTFTSLWQKHDKISLKRRKCLRDTAFFSVESAVRKNTTKACEEEAIHLMTDWKKGLSKPRL